MTEKKKIFLKINLFHRILQIIIKIKKKIRPFLFFFVPKKKTFQSNFFYKSIVNNKKKIFDNQKKGTELLAINNYNEKFIVNSSDKVIGRSIYINGDFEFGNFLHTLEILQKKILNKTLVDIGANIGSICIPAIKRGFFQNCIAIEPDPYNFDLLSKNIFINDIKRKIQTFNIGLGQYDNQQLEFEISGNNFGDHRVKSNSDEKDFYHSDKREIININIKKLDTIIQNFDPKETLVWIDVQGYEAFVLEGGFKTLCKKPPLVIEFCPFALDRFNSYNLLKKNLISFRYKNCYNINSKYYLKDLQENTYDDLYFYYKSKKEEQLISTNLLFFD